jgi:phospholipid transport system substrate-binding protein
MELSFAEALVLVLVVIVAAATAASSPLSVVKTADADVQKILGAKKPSVEQLAARADAYINFAELAKRSLGTNWNDLNRKERAEFSATMKGLLRESYAQKALADGRGSASVDYEDERVDGNEAVVNTLLVVKEDRFPVVYKLFREGPKADWRIYDVVTDDVSLVDTYKDQFRQVIAKKGFSGLLKSLKNKKEQLEKQELAAP